MRKLHHLEIIVAIPREGRCDFAGHVGMPSTEPCLQILGVSAFTSGQREAFSAMR
jgi:hypothetical protein